jgi:hypothetical protein
MGRIRKHPASHSRPAEDDIRNQEVLRANRELAAYFKGRRTEREARAALKIIKAFIRDRERSDPAARRPLPIAGAVRESSKAAGSRAAASRPRRRIRQPEAPASPETPPKSDEE